MNMSMQVSVCERKQKRNGGRTLSNQSIPYFKNHLMARYLKYLILKVVMYGCESWTIRKLSTEKLMLLNCGVEEDS